MCCKVKVVIYSFFFHAIISVAETLEGYQQLLLDGRQRMVHFKHLQLGKEVATLIAIGIAMNILVP